MSSLRRFIAGAVVGGWALSAFCTGAAAQTMADTEMVSARDQWEQRVVRAHPAPYQQAPGDRAAPAWSPIRGSRAWAPMHSASSVIHAGPMVPEDGAIMDELSAIPDDMDLAPMPVDEGYVQPAMEGMCEDCGMGCAVSGNCGDGWCGPPWPCGSWFRVAGYLLRHSSIFGGAHGFKGPADHGRNGNFGFHEGINLGGPLGGCLGLGYQLGLRATHSNFSGDQAFIDRDGGRDQLFFTAGIFRRAQCSGFQWGVAVDMLHDNYYAEADLRQVRAETALVLGGLREVGFWGAFGSGDDEVLLAQVDQSPLIGLEPTDLYAFFYRRHFSRGGQGRIWTGFSGAGDALVGADCTVPLVGSLALENNFLFLLPKEGLAEGAQQEEAWSVSVGLVWYPGRDAQCVFDNPFQPLFNVADNASFVFDVFGGGVP